MALLEDIDQTLLSLRALIEKKEYVHATVEPKGECTPGSFRTIPIGKHGKKAVICKPKGKTTTRVQHYLMPKEAGATKKSAEKWTKENAGKKPTKVRS